MTTSRSSRTKEIDYRFKPVPDSVIDSDHPDITASVLAVCWAITRLAKGKRFCDATREEILKAARVSPSTFVQSMRTLQAIGAVSTEVYARSPSRRKINLTFGTVAAVAEPGPSQESGARQASASGLNQSGGARQASASGLNQSGGARQAARPDPISRARRSLSRPIETSPERPDGREDAEAAQRQRPIPEPPAVGGTVPLGGALRSIMDRLPAPPADGPPPSVDEGVRVPQPVPDRPPPSSPAPPPPKRPDATKAQTLTPSQEQFLAMLTDEERSRWDALKPEVREPTLAAFAKGIDAAILKEVWPKLRRRAEPPRLPADDGNTPIHEFIKVLTEPGGSIYVRSVTDVWLRAIGDGSHGSRFWEGVLRSIAFGDLPSTVVLSPYETVAKMQAGGREFESIPAYMVTAVQQKIALHAGQPPGGEWTAQKTDRRVFSPKDPGGRSQNRSTSVTQGRA